MTEMMKQLQKIGIVPVVVLERAEDALPLAECLMEGGLPCAEVTFRTAAAEESIRQMAKAYPAYMVNEQLSIYRMECNASFRTEVLDGFMRANYAISNAIWRMCEIPPMVRKSIEVCRIKKQVKSLRRNWRRDYCCSEIPVTRNPFVYWFSYFVYKTLYLNLIRYRKYRQQRYYVVPEISEREGGR